MRICIRADGGSNIGMGHIIRTIVLAQEFKNRGNEVFYACKVDKTLSEKYKAGIEKIKEEGFEVIELNEKSLKNDIRNINADCIITDSYDVDEEYFDIVKESFKVSGCLDDENICKYFNVDFLINQNPYAETLNYKVNSCTKMLLGTKYAILRDEFRNVKKKNINKYIRDIMITVGGSDNNNLSEKIIKSFKNLKECNIHLVVGSGFKYKDELKKYESNNIKLYENVIMSKLMKRCDVAVSSCGSTLYELAACGTPTIGIVVADNQVMAAKAMDKLGIIKYESIENIDKTLKTLTEEKRKQMSSIAVKLVDVNGYKNIVNNIQEIFHTI
ncbi:UDP-2,4-diacetamido-2,4,6-trideoxy-beta-L-altropyranose hydrolase [Clostridium sp. JS66]|uniref:UDP-2,4-diacetamido-2,4, 6-trideoxy-beta-L-altropyranose hydrolase n=1 Tax=Clostridium sp. JS66 TaxID=3064705 RepID=UPI00298E3EE7|nr:UDP-2,4-diacetamido-2,4,6-trideoxy-beta-L-altropyranose hydrolase [Clostridium sp. JS66]WPC41017.1 UDP-2,4-diacetamido-2,4,6-trideoxy-beta-L-altropyranose hydrolase [Clostridium sp. JS66]